MSNKRCVGSVLQSDVIIPRADASSPYVHVYSLTDCKIQGVLSKCHLSFVLQSALQFGCYKFNKLLDFFARKTLCSNLSLIHSWLAVRTVKLKCFFGVVFFCYVIPGGVFLFVCNYGTVNSVDSCKSAVQYSRSFCILQQCKISAYAIRYTEKFLKVVWTKAGCRSGLI